MASSRTMRGGRQERWECPQCTLENEWVAEECAACGEPRPSPEELASKGDDGIPLWTGPGYQQLATSDIGALHGGWDDRSRCGACRWACCLLCTAWVLLVLLGFAGAADDAAQGHPILGNSANMATVGALERQVTANKTDALGSEAAQAEGWVMDEYGKLTGLIPALPPAPSPPPSEPLGTLLGGGLKGPTGAPLVQAEPTEAPPAQAEPTGAPPAEEEPKLVQGGFRLKGAAADAASFVNEPGFAQALKAAIAKIVGVREEDVHVFLSLVEDGGRRLAAGQSHIQVTYTIGVAASEQAERTMSQLSQLAPDAIVAESAQQLQLLRVAMPAVQVEADTSSVPFICDSPTADQYCPAAPSAVPSPAPSETTLALPEGQSTTGALLEAFTTSEPYDCSEGASRWKTGWSEDKRQWCCTHHDSLCVEPDTTPGPIAATTAAPDTTTAATTTAEPYNCNAGKSKWKTGWSDEKRLWCCSAHHVGCATTTTSSRDKSGSTSYNCSAGRAKWKTGWAAAKKRWCCTHHGAGCEKPSPTTSHASTSTQQLYNCSAGRKKWKKGWSEDKKRWCCKLMGFACSGTTTATETHTTTASVPHNCSAGRARWKKGWSAAKRHWCCKHEGFGCASTTVLKADKATATMTTTASTTLSDTLSTALPFNCSAGKAMLQKGWSIQKRHWCCKHSGVGCASDKATATMSTTISTTLSATAKTQGETQTVTTLLYDCSEGTTKWKTGWSVGKKRWCCKQSGVGCPTSTSTTSMSVTSVTTSTGTAPPSSTSSATLSASSAAGADIRKYDCAAELWDWAKEWSRHKQAWCCQHEGRGCATTTRAYDCVTGYSDRDRAWSENQRDWCCRHEGRGCLAALSAPAYDCKEGSSVAHWSAGKRAWCCLNQRLACPGEAQLTSDSQPYDCFSSYTQWLEGLVHWSEGRKAWCCLTEGRACPTLQASTVVGSTAPTVSTTTSTAPFGCNATCGSGSVQCGERIRDISQSRFPGQPNSCLRAFSEVLSECPVCSTCPLNTACTAKKEDFDCSARFSTWQTSWSSEKKAWCCKMAGIACSNKETVTTTVALPATTISETVTTTVALAATTISETLTTSVAPPATTTSARPATAPAVQMGGNAGTQVSAEPWDCDDSSAELVAQWSPIMRGWCCKHHGSGCDGSTTAKDDAPQHVHRAHQSHQISQLHVCSADAQATWSSDKRSWCCSRQRIGCSDEDEASRMTTSLPFDCLAGLNNFEAGWSMAKTRWCCEHEGRGCPETTTTSPPYDCRAGISNWEAGWSKAKKAWCWSTDQGTTSQAPSHEPPAYDCEASLASWESDWSASKRRWCCEHAGEGCGGQKGSSSTRRRKEDSD